MIRGVGAALLVALAASVAATQGAGPRPRTELTILTGGESGTYYAVARDLERLLDEIAPDAGVDLDVVPTQGALQNAIEVFRHDAIHLGITQLDVVSYLSIYGKDNAEARRVVEGLQVVLPLYDEEVHLLARPGVHGIAGLRGKRVAIGEPGSGTTVTAMTLLHLAGVKPRDLQTLEAAEALDALRTGEIDAAFHVVGAPARLLLERIAPADRITLVPIRLEPHPEDAAMAVRSGITTAGATRCEAIGELARLAVDHLDWLRANGHPKWQAVTLDPARLLAAPRLSPCVAQRLGR
jgi:TRAP transporter TAXI family solute receptor